jgi:hypothetical protein
VWLPSAAVAAAASLSRGCASPRLVQESVRPRQRECEEALVQLLLQGARPLVRRLVCACVCELLHKGDRFSIFARLNALVGFLEQPASLVAPTAARLGALECVAVLARTHGRQVMHPLGLRELEDVVERGCTPPARGSATGAVSLTPPFFFSFFLENHSGSPWAQRFTSL